MLELVEGLCRGYQSYGARLNAIHQLAKAGYNYFVPYVDVHAPFALQYGLANWVQPGTVWVDGGYPIHTNNWCRRRKYPRCRRPWVNLP